MSTEAAKARYRRYYARHTDIIRRRHKRWRDAHKESENKRIKVWYIKNKKRVNARQRKNRLDLKLEMIKAYGGQCACCGETDPAFLTLDHVYGDGATERRRFGLQYHIVRHLRGLKWPKGRHRILCWNCNCATSSGRVCPHKKKIELKVA